MAGSKEMYEKHFQVYSHIINVYGKEVLLKVLKWFYMGRNQRYFDFLGYCVNVEQLEDELDGFSVSDYKCKEPEDYDIEVIHMLLKTVCFLYDRKPVNMRGDEEYELLEEGINILVCEHIKTKDYKETFKLDMHEIGERIFQIMALYTGIIVRAGSLGNVGDDDFSSFDKEMAKKVINILPHSDERQAAFEEIKRNVQHLRATVSGEVDDFIGSVLQDKFTELVTKKTGGLSKNDPFFYYLSQLVVEKADDSSSSCEDESDKGAANVAKNTVTLGHKSNIDPFFAHLEQLAGKKFNSYFRDCADESNKGASKESNAKETSGSSGKKQSSPTKPRTSGSNKSSSCSTSKDTKSFVPQKGNLDIISAYTGQGVAEYSDLDFKDKGKKVLPSNSVSKDSHSIRSLQSMIRSTFRPEKASGLQSAEDKSQLTFHKYTDVSLKQHQKYSRKPSHQVKLQDLFSVEGMNDDTAEIIILSGEAGMGKTWCMRYIEEKWRSEETDFGKLATREVLIPYELQKNYCNSLTDLVSSLLEECHKCIEVEGEILKEAILELPILVMLDNYDESCEMSCQLVKEVLQMSGKDLRIIITSRPQYVDSLYKLIPKFRRKYVAHLCLNSIRPSHHRNFITGIFDSAKTKQCSIGKKECVQFEQAKEGLLKCLPEIYSAVGEDLCNPLMLNIITEMWLENHHSCEDGMT